MTWQACICRWSARALTVLLLSSVQASAARFVFHDRDDGISCAYFDVGLKVTWPRGKPDSVDVDAVVDGPRPYATVQIRTDDSRRVIRMDVTALVLEWVSGRYPNDGLLVQMRTGSYLEFNSREDVDRQLRPQLALTFAGDRYRLVEPVADASLDCTSDMGLGLRPKLLLKGSSALAMRFDLAPYAGLGPPTKAELVLVRTRDPSSPSATLAVQRLVPPIGVAGRARLNGLASKFHQDRGIESDSKVVFADGFESMVLDKRWTRGMTAPSRRVSDDEPQRFDPLVGAALRITIPKGTQVGLDLRYKFKLHTGTEPDEIYFRYYLWLADDWLQASEGGKLPGLAATYGRAAWGDRPWDGSKGWSMRGAIETPLRQGHPADNRMMLGSNAYHFRSNRLGAFMSWPGSDLAALVQPRRWYCIEQHMKLNTPGLENGVFQVWIDGQSVLARSDLRLRDTPDIHIEEVWMNFFHGGGGSPPVDIHAYIDGVVVAREYIGPMGK